MKPSEKTDIVCIKKIIKYIGSINECFTHFKINSHEDLENTHLAQLAVTQAITNIYEAKKRFRPEAISLIPNFDKIKISRARNIASHDYESVDFVIIYGICQGLMRNSVLDELNEVIISENENQPNNH